MKKNKLLLALIINSFISINIYSMAEASAPTHATSPILEPDALTSLLRKNTTISTLSNDTQIALASQIPAAYNCLHYAVLENNANNVEWLLKNGAEMHIDQDCYFGGTYVRNKFTPLHLAIIPEIVNLLLDAGANINKRCEEFDLQKGSCMMCLGKDFTPLQALYFRKKVEPEYDLPFWKTPEGRIALDQCIAILEDAELKAPMRPTRAAWLSAVYQTTKLLD